VKRSGLVVSVFLIAAGANGFATLLAGQGLSAIWFG
jgi:hypothetical protein